jgi:hypothetical protein
MTQSAVLFFRKEKKQPLNFFCSVVFYDWYIIEVKAKKVN